MQNSDLNITYTFDLTASPHSFILVDTTDWATLGIATSKVDETFTLTSVNGVFHSNTNYGSPDIDRNVTDTFTDGLPLANGSAVSGLYTINHRVRITREPFSYAIVAVNVAQQLFGISGNHLSNVLNSFLIGGTHNFQITGSTGNDGNYVIDPVNCSYDAALDITYISVTAAPGSAIADGDIYFETTTYYTKTYTYNLCLTAPTVSIQITSDCAAATLTSVDTSNYNALYCGSPSVTLIPTVTSRVHTIEYPKSPTTGIPVHADVVGSTDTLSLISPDVWTGGYQTTIVTDLTYILPDGSVVLVKVTGYETHVIECSNALCCAYQCIENVYTNYVTEQQNKIGGGKWGVILTQVISEWMLYSIAYGCGNTAEAEEHLGNLIDIVKAQDCNCCNQDSAAPVQITPVIGGGGSGGGTTVVVGGTNITVTSNTIGGTTTYTVSFPTANLNAFINAQLANQALFDHSDTVLLALANNQVVMYDQATGVWNNVNMNLGHLSDIDYTGKATGYVLTWDAGTGKAKFEPASVANVLHNTAGTDVGVDANLFEKNLDNYLLPANTLANGDFILIESLFETDGLLTEKVARTYFGGVAIVVTNISYPKTVRQWLKITRVSAILAFCEWGFAVSGLPATLFEGGQVSYTLATNFAANQTIEITGQNLAVATANAIKKKYLQVTINKK